VSGFLFNGRPDEIAAELESKYPYDLMPGFVDDYTYEELYRVRPTRWDEHVTPRNHFPIISRPS
jgi:hypothetical protein